MKTITNGYRATHRSRRLFIAVMAGCVGAVVVVAATAVTARGAGAGPTWEQRAANQAGGELSPPDREFVATALRACRQQSRLAASGVRRALSSEVRSLAQQLETDHRSLADSLEAIWRRTGTAAEKPVASAAEPDLALADKAGADFDREFVRVVTRESGRILTAFEQAASTARDSGVRDLAARGLPVLRAHRTALTGLNKAVE